VRERRQHLAHHVGDGHGHGRGRAARADGHHGVGVVRDRPPGAAQLGAQMHRHQAVGRERLVHLGGHVLGALVLRREATQPQPVRLGGGPQALARGVVHGRAAQGASNVTLAV
jgi:hypothetical protein